MRASLITSLPFRKVSIHSCSNKQGTKGIKQWPIDWCTSPMIIHKLPFCNNNLGLKRLDTQQNDLTWLIINLVCRSWRLEYASMKIMLTGILCRYSRCIYFQQYNFRKLTLSEEIQLFITNLLYVLSYASHYTREEIFTR